MIEPAAVGGVGFVGVRLGSVGSTPALVWRSALVCLHDDDPSGVRLQMPHDCPTQKIQSGPGHVIVNAGSRRCGNSPRSGVHRRCSRSDRA